MKSGLKNNALRRLNLIKGQINGLFRMIEEERYCVDIITQIEAVREALSSTGDLILENHLETHVADDIKNGKGKRATQEILKIYKLAQK